MHRAIRKMPELDSLPISPVQDWSREVGQSVFLLAALILATLSMPGLAQATTTPSRSPAAPTAPVWHNPAGTQYSIFDPCGGPKEILNKIDPSPCVLVVGQSE